MFRRVLRKLRGRPQAQGNPPPLLATSPLSEGRQNELTAKIAELGPWFHNMNLADGIWTNPGNNGPGPDYPAWRWNLVAPLLPDIQGKRCLDVGCSSGFFSLKLKQGGAASVLGIDHGEQIRAISQARFAAEWLGLSAEFKPMSVYDAGSHPERFDLVLFMGVFYHLRHPMLALEAIRQVCTGTLILQTITTPHRQGSYEPCPPAGQIDCSLRGRSLNQPDFPMMRFVEGGIDGDTSCWFVPSAEAVLAMLRACNFKPETMIFPTSHEIIVRASAS